MRKRVEMAAKYLEEGVVALLPIYTENGNASRIYTCKNEYTDNRSLRWILQQMSAYLGSDLVLLRQQYADYLQRRHHVPFPLSPGIILLPLKMREPRIAGDTTLGYINALQIEKITPEAPSPPHRSSILLKGGLTIPCLNTFTTLQMRCLHRCAHWRSNTKNNIGNGKRHHTSKLPVYNKNFLQDFS